jgi:HlyD family secretion protein
MNRTLILILIVAAVALGGWIVVADPFGGSSDASLKGVQARRGPLDITVLETGNLKAAKSVSLRSEIEGRTTILYLIDEGSQVEPGTLLCRLDTANLVDDSVNQEIAVRNAESAMVKAEQALQIQGSQNQSDIAAAERRLEFAIKDLEKYREGDWPQQLKQAGDDILLAEEELKRAEDKLTWSQTLFDDGFLTRTELEADQLASQRNTIRLEQSKRAKELLEQYDYPRQIRSLEADVDEFGRELERVKLQAAARLVDFQTDLDSKVRKLELENEKFDKIIQQLDKTEIVAPVSGMVVYYKERSRWGNGDPISEGMEVRERQELITIPSSDGMVVEASVHESVLEQVNVGQEVRITVDALPEREFRGRVTSKGVLPDQNSWWANPDLRVYRTEIAVLDPDPAMRPGMTCAIRVQVAHLPDVVHIPVQARFFRGEQAVVFISNDGEIEVREVQLGLFNESWIEVMSGLEEGEEVLLSAPPGFDFADVPPMSPQLGPGEPTTQGTGGAPGAGAPSYGDGASGGARSQGGGRPSSSREGADAKGAGRPAGKGSRDAGDASAAESSAATAPAPDATAAPVGAEAVGAATAPAASEVPGQ